MTPSDEGPTPPEPRRPSSGNPSGTSSRVYVYPLLQVFMLTKQVEEMVRYYSAKMKEGAI